MLAFSASPITKLTAEALWRIQWWTDQAPILEFKGARVGKAPRFLPVSVAEWGGPSLLGPYAMQITTCLNGFYRLTVILLYGVRR